MQDLSNRILTYYWEHFDELSFDKQFHFASRLYLWSEDPLACQKLDELRPQFTSHSHYSEALNEVIEQAKLLPVHGSKNASRIRQPYFEKYPMLKTYVIALFRVTFMRSIYNVDLAGEFYSHFSEAELNNFAERLLSDRQALAILSTHAINFLYLYSNLSDLEIDPTYLWQIGQTEYDHSSLLHLQLKIYLYTHCIIGDSGFYAKAITDHPAYSKMIADLDHLVDKHFQDVNLDNKFEFLVCARQLNYESQLFERIGNEAERSISPQGSFLIDRHNNNPQSDNTDLNSSEHRNALFIMANAPSQKYH